MKKLLSLGLLLLVGGVLFSGSSDGVAVAFHQKWIEGQKQELRDTPLDLNNADQVFWHIFSNLDPEATVYPTENYYYFIFKSNGKEIWGNIRFSPEDRDIGKLNFAYWESRPVDQSQKDQELTVIESYEAADGLEIKKISNLEYLVSYRDKDVIFNLNSVEQRPPIASRSGADEVFLQRTFDESGFGFYLIFNKPASHLMFVLDEEKKLPDSLITFKDVLAVGEKSGFAFFVDKKYDRKILMGVHAENIKRNNYYDGPFDQLADNYIVGEELKNYLEAAYPALKGMMDKYGRFLDSLDVRLAITPYKTYSATEELYDIIKRCRGLYADSEFYACITPDPKNG